MPPRFVFVGLALIAAAPLPVAAKRHAATASRPRAAAPAPAEGAGGGAPKPIGAWGEWTALTRDENGQTACYAFAYPTASTPRLAGRGRPVLTVTERPSGRDTVAFSAGYAFAANAETTLQVEGASLPFYTSGRFAFARDGAAAVAAMRKARQAVMRGPDPHGATVTDTFGLRGFDQASTAINKACPGR